MWPQFMSLLLVLLSHIAQAKKRFNKANDAVKLEDIQSLTFFKDRTTTARRVKAIPQISIIGGSAASSGFVPETVRCRNAGSSYNSGDIEWTCTASLPSDYKLGSTDVVCEGYDSPDDPFVLKGSCGVELRILLSDVGEESWKQRGFRSGKQNNSLGHNESNDWSSAIFGIIFIAVFAWIIWGFIKSLLQSSGNDSSRRRGPRSRGSRGSSSGGGYDDDDDPPPPYDSQPPQQPKFHSKRSQARTDTRSGGGSWRPGFWTGAATGATAGYFAGNRQARRGQQNTGWFGGNTWNSGEGPSTTVNFGGSGRSANQDHAAERHESTGFGGTRRR